MRKVQDYYAKKAKKDNYPARSVYKLEEVQLKYKFLRRGDSVLDIGCSPGSWSLYASEVIGPKGIVVGVDLKQTRQQPRPGGAPIHWVCMDVRDEICLKKIREIRPSFRAVISDIAPKTTGNRWADAQQSLMLVRTTFDLANILLLPKGNFITKIFQGEDVPGFVAELGRCFEMVKVVKPKSSRTESREVFVLATGFKKK